MIHFSKFGWAVGMSAAMALSMGSGAAFAQQKRVAIANFGELPQLSELIAGFKKGMQKNGFAEGTDVVYSTSHTNFDASLVPQMLTKLQSEKPNLMLSLTTPVSQIAKKSLAGSGIPVIFSAVTDPVAAKLVPSVTEGDAGMTGASDRLDVVATLSFIRKLLPNAKTIGFPYNPGEANDVATLEEVKAAAAKAGFKVATVGVDSTNDIQQRIASLRGKADVIYNPSSSLLQSGVAAVTAGARAVGLPVVNALVAEDLVRNGAILATFALTPEQVGISAGVLAAKVLKGADPKTLPPVFAAEAEHSARISKKALAVMNLTLPAALANCNCVLD